MNNNDILSSFRNEQRLKRQRNLSMDTVYDNHVKDTVYDNHVKDSVYDNHVNDSVFETIIKDINKLKLDSQVNNNNDLLQKLFKKVEDLEKNIKKNLNQQNLFDEINKLNIKFEKLQKNIEKNLVEKEYTIEHLQNELNILRDELKSNIYEKKDNDYFC